MRSCRPFSLFDDLLQLHVIAKPILGVPKVAVYLIYLAIAGHWVISQRRELRRTRAELLVAAGGAFAVSIGLDQVAFLVPWLNASQRLLAEDAAKFLGVLAWAQFFALTSGAIVTSIVSELRARARVDPSSAPPHAQAPAPSAETADHPLPASSATISA